MKTKSLRYEMKLLLYIIELLNNKLIINLDVINEISLSRFKYQKK